MVFAKNSDRPPGEAQVLLPHRARAGGRNARHAVPPHRRSAARPRSSARTPRGSGAPSTGERARRRDRQREDLDRRRPPRAARRPPRHGPRAARPRTGTRLPTTAFEAITAALEAHGQGGSGEPGIDEPYFSSFLVVDAHGGWTIETSGRTWAARPVHDGTSISNRVSLTTDWTRASADVTAGDDFDRRRAPDTPTWIADHRLAATRACVAAPFARSGRRHDRRRRRDAARPRPRTLGRTRCRRCRLRASGPDARRVPDAGSAGQRVHAPARLPGDDRVAGRRPARRRARSGVGLPRQPVHLRVRAVLPARRAGRAA